MNTELALVESRALRDTYRTRIDVLDHFDWFKMTDGRDHLTADEVAAMYEVQVKTLHKEVERNEDELSSNGYSKMTKDQAIRHNVVLKTTYNYPQGVMTFDRRAFLNVGMLLRDAPRAVAVRSYLLNVEELSSSAVKDTAMALLSPSEYMTLACSGVTRLPDGTELSPKEARKERGLARRRDTERKARERAQIPGGDEWTPEVVTWFKENDGATAEQIVRLALRSLGAAADVTDVQRAFGTAKAYLRSDVAQGVHEDRFGSTRFGLKLSFSLAEKTMELYRPRNPKHGLDGSSAYS